MVKISVIVPIYNTEKYLNECLDCLVNQSFNDIEIICIDDGSTDNSLGILKDYEENDTRFRVITQENSGAGASRNRGIELAEGEYIYFMDSDDFLELNALEQLFKLSDENDLDMIIFKLINYHDQTKEETTRYYYEMPYLKHMYNKVFNFRDIKEFLLRLPVTPQGKFFKRDLISNIRFPESLILEDNPFFFEAVLKAKRIFIYDEYLCHRRIREGSVMQSSNEKFIDIIQISNLVLRIFKKYSVYDEFKRDLIEKKIKKTYDRFSEVSDDFKPTFFNRIKEDFKNMEYEFGCDSAFIEEIDSKSRFIFKIALSSKDHEEFIANVTNYDAEKKDTDVLLNKSGNANNKKKDTGVLLNKSENANNKKKEDSYLRNQSKHSANSFKDKKYFNKIMKFFK